MKNRKVLDRAVSDIEVLKKRDTELINLTGNLDQPFGLNGEVLHSPAPLQRIHCMATATLIRDDVKVKV